MTKQEAKLIALDKLRIYAILPIALRKVEFLSAPLQDQIKSFHNKCPLCELFCSDPNDGYHCGDCPLICPDCNRVDAESLQNNIKLLRKWDTETARQERQGAE